MARKRSRTNSEPPKIQENEEVEMVSEYEKSREERIKQNLERMQKLGIINLALQLKSPNKSSTTTTTHSTIRPHFSATLLPPPGPRRRSSRLQDASPVSYCEVEVSKGKSLESLLRLEGSRPEVYTEEHEKLLGSTEKSWTLFVDGYGKDGKRIYDQVNGKSCHQCRQKTLGHHTRCSQCNMGQGQFCGDCLYIRYGEHVLEAKQNPNWICPVCRGICNCSLCRHAKGWPPTGSLYRKISALGYKSVAHYLVQTRRENAESDDIKTKVPLSAERSLAFVETETTSTNVDTSESNFSPQELLDYSSEEAKSFKISNEDIQENACHSVDALSNSKLVPENEIEIVGKPEIAFAAPEDCQGSPESQITEPKQKVEIEEEKGFEISVEKEMSNGDVMKITEEAVFSNSEIEEFSCGPTSVVSLNEDRLQKPIASIQKNIHSEDPVANGIVGRLGLSQNDNNGHEEEVNESTVGNTKPLSGELSLELIFNDDPKDVIEVKEDKEDDTEKTPISKKKRGRASEPVADSIAGRLRQRRPRIN
ncbi:hypothetical protein Leryth_010730 [Lithospermum erythrorhizon]|nr:hypothetical protein Leryth_010730 [Lithospermum erythrorhizon]